MFKKLLVGVIAIGAVAGLIGVAAGPLHRHGTRLLTNQFTAGTVVTHRPPRYSDRSRSTNMAPGDEDYKEITVSNDGTLELRYAVTSVADA